MTTALVVVSEVGTDMGKRPSDKHFASWLGLCLGSKMTGGKLMSGKTKRCAHRSAQTLRPKRQRPCDKAQSALGACYWRMYARMDRSEAATTAAPELARLIYAMLTNAGKCTNRGKHYFGECYR